MADEGFKRKLTAILSADVIEYSRLMRDDEEATVRDLAAHRALITEIIQQHNGRVVDSPGDNILAEFVSVVDAVNGAIKIQEEITKSNEEIPEDRRMELRIGINLGDVIEEEERIYGDGVNIAARVEGLAIGGGIAISGIVYDSIKDKLSLGYQYLGEQEVKNIPDPVRVYRLLTEPADVGKMIGEEKPKLKKWLWAASGAIALIILMVGTIAIWNNYFRAQIEPASAEKMAYPLPNKASIAVLPFVNMSGDPKQEYFSDGITESIIMALSKISDMFVIARNSTFIYKGKAVKIQTIAEELGVRYVLEGSVQKIENRVRITAQLIDALKGKHLWAERYDRDLRDLFDLQDEITLKIIAALQVKMKSGENAFVPDVTTDNLEAYLKYMQANEQLQLWNKEGNIMSRKFAEEAITLDPEFAGAYLTLSATHLMDMMYGSTESPEQSLKLAEEMVRKAISLNGAYAEARAFLGRIYLTKRQYDEAIAEGERAVALSPNSAFVNAALAFSLGYAGKPEEAIVLYEKAIRLSPSETWYMWGLGDCYRMLSRYEEAISEYRKAIKLGPDDVFAHAGAAAVYALWDREKEARAEAAEVLRIDPKFSLESFSKGLLYKNPKDLELRINAMRKAGLPDNPPLKLPDKPSIAVLPFDNMSGDPEQEYLCSGIADQIINSIAKIPYIIVIARNSSFAYKGKSVNVQQIAENLGVRYILEGSLQRDNENVRINTQLIDAKTGGHLWAENYDRKLDDIFALQDAICKNIMVALQVKLTEGEMARMQADTVSIKAYAKALKAMEHYYRRTKEDALIARKLLQESITLDPQYAAAYVLVGWTYLDDIWLRMTKTPSESIARAEEMVQKAISIHGVTAGENGLLSCIYLLKKDLDKAISYARKAVEQGPNFANVHNIMGLALKSNGQYEEAISSFKKALQLDPIGRIARMSNLAWVYLYTKQFEKAISIWNETLARNPDYLFAYYGLTAAYWLSGSEDQARQAAQQVLRINPKFSLDYWEKQSTIKDSDLEEQLFNAWRKAGLK